MKNRKVVLIILLILFIITLIFIFLTLGKTYYSELKIVNDKKETYLKLSDFLKNTTAYIVIW